MRSAIHIAMKGILGRKIVLIGIGSCILVVAAIIAISGAPAAETDKQQSTAPEHSPTTRRPASTIHQADKPTQAADPSSSAPATTGQVQRPLALPPRAVEPNPATNPSETMQALTKERSEVNSKMQ